MLKQITVLTVAASLVATTMLPAFAGPSPVAAAAAPASSGTGLGAWVAGGIVGVAGFLGLYDFGRRTTCSGDFLRLGGPGFTEPLSVGNVMIPQCPAGRGKRKP